jgi:hypothetical protein
LIALRLEVRNNPELSRLSVCDHQIKIAITFRLFYRPLLSFTS